MGDLLIPEYNIWGINVEVDDNIEFNIEPDSAIWDIKIEVNDEIDNDGDGDGDGDGDITKTKSNTGPSPIMEVVSSRGMYNLLEKVTRTAHMDLEEARGGDGGKCKVSDQYPLGPPPPPPSLIPSRRDSGMTRLCFGGRSEPEVDFHRHYQYYVGNHGIWGDMVHPDSYGVPEDLRRLLQLD